MTPSFPTGPRHLRGPIAAPRLVERVERVESPRSPGSSPRVVQLVDWKVAVAATVLGNIGKLTSKIAQSHHDHPCFLKIGISGCVRLIFSILHPICIKPPYKTQQVFFNWSGIPRFLGQPLNCLWFCGINQYAEPRKQREPKNDNYSFLGRQLENGWCSVIVSMFLLEHSHWANRDIATINDERC